MISDSSKISTATAQIDSPNKEYFIDALGESENLYEKIVRSLPAAIYICDIKGRIKLFNEAAADLWGRRPVIDEDLWCGSWRIYRPNGSEMPLDECPMAVTLREGRPVTGVEIIIERPDGERRNVMPHPRPIFNSSDELIGAVNMLLDITEQKQTEQVLRDSEERFKSVADAAPVLIWMAGKDKRRTYFNKYWLDFTGRTIEQESGDGWIGNLHPEDTEIYLNAYHSQLNRHKGFQVDYRLRRNDGEYRWISAHGVPRFSFDGNFVGYIGTCVDIHDKKMLEQKKDEFLAVASHELKTPLTSAKAYIELLEELSGERNDNEMVHLAQKAGTSIERLNSLISELLDLTKIQHGKLQLNKEHFNINSLIDETIDIMQRSSPAYKILKQGETDQIIYGDKNRLQQVFANLLSNAIRYSPDSNKVEVNISTADHNILIEVKDYGFGIPKHDLDNIFDRFYQVERKKNSSQGLGIGLYISADIVQRHGGKIWAESELEKGSSFFFSLPLE